MRLAIAAIVFLILQTAAAQDSEPDEVVIADSLDWDGYPAFYVDATRKIKIKMQRAMEETIAAGDINCPLRGHFSWICTDSQYRFFHGITGHGKFAFRAFACSSSVMRRQKYYPELLLTLAHCVELWRNPENEQYYVLVTDDVLGLDDA
jgi:hypothetical protein